MDKETNPRTGIHFTVGFLKGVLISIQLTGKHLTDPEVALEKIINDVDRGLEQYRLFEEAKGIK